MIQETKLRKQRKNESDNDYLAYVQEALNDVGLNSFNPEDPSYYDFDISKKVIYKVPVEEYEEYIDKKTKRMGIWVTETFYSDLLILQQAYPEFTVNELLYHIASEHIKFLKSQKYWEDMLDLIKKIEEKKNMFISDNQK